MYLQIEMDIFNIYWYFQLRHFLFCSVVLHINALHFKIYIFTNLNLYLREWNYLHMYNLNRTANVAIYRSFLFPILPFEVQVKADKGWQRI